MEQDPTPLAQELCDCPTSFSVCDTTSLVRISTESPTFPSVGAAAAQMLLLHPLIRRRATAELMKKFETTNSPAQDAIMAHWTMVSSFVASHGCRIPSYRALHGPALISYYRCQDVQFVANQKRGPRIAHQHHGILPDPYHQRILCALGLGVSLLHMRNGDLHK